MERWISHGAGVAFAGGVVNTLCDLLLTPGPGPGSVLSSPASIAVTLAETPPNRVAVATVVGALAITTWVLATPALIRLILPAGRKLAAAVGLLNILAVGGCVTFHVATGALAWVGRLANPPDPALLAPLSQLLQGVMGMIFLALAACLAVAAWRSRDIPRWLPFASPLVSMSIFVIPATTLPAPFGLPLALSASTAGGTLWLLLLWRSSMSA